MGWYRIRGTFQVGEVTGDGHKGKYVSFQGIRYREFLFGLERPVAILFIVHTKYYRARGYESGQLGWT